MKQSPLLSLIESTTLEVLDKQKGEDIDKILAQSLPKLQKLLEPAMKQYISSKLKGSIQEVELPTVGQVVNKTTDVAKAGGRTTQVMAARVASMIPGGLGIELGALYAASKDMSVDPKVRFWITVALLNLVSGNFGIPGDISSYIMDLITIPTDAIPIIGGMASNAIKTALAPLHGIDDAALIMWAKRKIRKANLPAAKHYAEFEKWAGLPAGSLTPSKAKSAADKSPSAPHNMFALTRGKKEGEKQQESIMKKSALMKIIREEVEVVLTNEEAAEIFDIDLDRLNEISRPSFREMWNLLSQWIEDQGVREKSPEYDQMEKEFLAQHGWDQGKFDAAADIAREAGDIAFLEEAWKGDPEVNQTGEYADKTKDELCAMKKGLMDKESRTEPEQKKVRQINFALRSKQKGPKFGKVGC